MKTLSKAKVDKPIRKRKKTEIDVELENKTLSSLPGIHRLRQLEEKRMEDGIKELGAIFKRHE